MEADVEEFLVGLYRFCKGYFGKMDATNQKKLPETPGGEEKTLMGQKRLEPKKINVVKNVVQWSGGGCKMFIFIILIFTLLLIYQTLIKDIINNRFYLCNLYLLIIVSITLFFHAFMLLLFEYHLKGGRGDKLNCNYYKI